MVMMAIIIIIMNTEINTIKLSFADHDVRFLFLYLKGYCNAENKNIFI